MIISESLYLSNIYCCCFVRMEAHTEILREVKLLGCNVGNQSGVRPLVIPKNTPPCLGLVHSPHLPPVNSNSTVGLNSYLRGGSCEYTAKPQQNKHTHTHTHTQTHTHERRNMVRMNVRNYCIISFCNHVVLCSQH